MAGRESPARQDFEEMEAPRYLEKIDMPEDESSQAAAPKSTQASLDLIQSLWTGHLSLIDKSLEDLEAEDHISRSRLLSHTEHKDKERAQLAIQQQIHALTVGVVLSVRKAVGLAKEIGEIDTYPWNDLLKSSVLQQKQISKATIKVGKLRKTLLKNHSRLWLWYDSLCQEWSLRAGLSTGLSLLIQAEKEAGLKQGEWEDLELIRMLAKEVKTGEGALLRKTNKKPKHRTSKHRKLKFDVHEKLLNFMAPQTPSFDPRSEKVLNSLFGRKTLQSDEPVLLDIPLI